ncbi:MAG: hypothetical protein J6U16_01485 [Ruminococcus sp.]|nr:hypothetical protein [Ruminococcus sp.]
MKDKSYRVALGGIVSALCLVTMFLAGIVTPLYIVLPLIAGVMLLIIVEEVSISWAMLTYVAVSLLSLFITADKEAALLFIMLFGHYPMLRFFLQKIRIGIIRLLLKQTVFNSCALSFFYVTVYIFGIKQMIEDMNDFGKYGAIALLVLCNVIFLLYDFNLDVVYKVYIKRIMPRFKKKR